MISSPCQQLEKVIIALCDDIASPVAMTVKSHVEKGEWIQLQRLKVSPQQYTCSESYFKDSVIVDLLRKTDMDVGIDTEAAAVKTFWDCEAMNAKTNARLRRYLPDLFVSEDPMDNAMFDFILTWRKEVANVLRSVPDDLTPSFGKGSTFGDRGALTTIPDKMSGRPTITDSARCVIPLWERTAWKRSLVTESPYLSDPETVRGNRFSTAPKSGLTRRGICIEPSLNMSFQLPVGKHMKHMLLRKGIDLKHGQQLHRDRAQASSLWDGDATIDLSNASDTICRVLPELLLEGPWFELLNSLRSPFTLIEGRWVHLEKFSSMGNGFTFELETLIFVTLARCVITREGGDPHRVLCYGDDLIVPKPYVAAFRKALAFFGFTPNEGKTFTDGPFRESCGGDFWSGVPVRAHFLKELPYEPQHWMALANGLYRVGHSDLRNNSRWLFLRGAHQLCLDALPSNIRRLTGPSYLGDIVVHNDDPSSWKVRYKQSKDDSGNPCYSSPIVRTYSPVHESLPWDYWKPEAQLAAALYGLPSSGVIPRDGVSGHKESFAYLMRNDWLPEVRIVP